MRRIRLAISTAEIRSALPSCGSVRRPAAVFTIQDNLARAFKPRGSSKNAKPGAWLEVSLDEAPALRAAIESHDPVVAMATEGEVSAPVLEALGPGDGDKVYLFPVVAGKEVVIMFCAAGGLHAAAVELVTGVAALHWESLSVSAQPKPAGLLTNSGAMWKQAPAAPPDKKPGGKWWELTPHDRQLHIKAQRFARRHAAK